MTARDPFSVAAGNEAARISARVEKRLRELERRPQGAAGNSAAFSRAANRLCELRPVRVGLTLALKRGERAYTTVVTVDGVSTPVAFTKNGWFTQEMVDREIARVRKEKSGARACLRTLSSSRRGSRPVPSLVVSPLACHRNRKNSAHPVIETDN